jgi:hypothetical protein
MPRYALQSAISAATHEEKRTGISNVSNSAYPIFARNLRTRRDNLLATIKMLQSRLAKTEVAA